MRNDDIYDDPDLKLFLEDSEREMLPKMKDASMSVVLLSGKVDIKLCVEVGAAILFDKPIVAIISPGAKVSANMKRIASVIVEGDVRDDATQLKIQEAITKVFENDRRAQ